MTSVTLYRLPRGGASAGAFALLGAAVLSLIFAGLGFEALGFGSLSRHMAVHILLMDGFAPAVAVLLLGLASTAGNVPSRPMSVAAPTLVQLAALWGWHSPAAMQFAFGSAGGHLLMQASLFAVALWFWTAVLAMRGPERWRALLALLVTAKLFCLLGAIVLFAPRPLYNLAAAAMGHAHAPAAAGPSDQHLAGLLMLIACPIAYVLAGIVLSARWIAEIAATDGVGAGPAGPQRS